MQKEITIESIKRIDLSKGQMLHILTPDATNEEVKEYAKDINLALEDYCKEHNLIPPIIFVTGEGCVMTSVPFNEKIQQA